MFTIAVCDDDKTFLSMLKNQLDRLCFALPDSMGTKVLSFHGAQDLLQYLKENTAEIIFLDIEMPNMDGFALSESLHENYPKTIIIFISSHHELVYTSLKYRPFRFIRKDRFTTELEEALQASISEFLKNNISHLFCTTDGEKYLLLKDILYLESQKNYYIIHCCNGNYKCRGSLYEMESLLFKHDFYRIHASFLINLEHIRIFSENKIVLTDGTKLDISRNKISTFKEQYIDFLRRRASL